jgi:hypothetical protein
MVNFKFGIRDLAKYMGNIGISLRLGIGIHNTLASNNCVKLLKPPEIQIPPPSTSLSDSLTHS